MASVWNLEGTDIYVTSHTEDADVKLAELVVLDANNTSTLHFFGTSGDKVNIAGKVFSETNKDTLQGYRNTNATVTLTSDQGNEGDFKILKFQTKKFGPFVSLQLPGYAAETTTIYDFTAELVKV